MNQKKLICLEFTTLLYLFSFLQVSSYSVSLTSTATITTFSEVNNVTDRSALLSIKSMISGDPTGSLASWNDSIHFCEWIGVTCGGGRHTQRVISLELSSLALNGGISPAVGNLTFLKSMDLSDNQFHGPIPGEIGRLDRLQNLNLSVNLLQGGIPATLSQCSQLQNLSMRGNMLSGEIPPVLGQGCLNLRVITLRNNSITGQIPPSFTNLSYLSFLALNDNQLSGVIPPSIGNLNSLTEFYLGGNTLSGSIPPSLGKLSKLKILNFVENNLHGVIPPSIWNLSSLSYLHLGINNLSGITPPNAFQALSLLEVIVLAENQFHGPIPMLFYNSSRLTNIVFSKNMFSGNIPTNLGSLQNLETLILQFNQMEANGPTGWNFLPNLANCTNLSILALDTNNLTGVLPNSIANLSSNLQILRIGDNKISGKISPMIGNLKSLNGLDLGLNLLEGSIPDSIGMLQNLIVLDLSNNKLSGSIPSTIRNLTQLNNLYLDFNKLTGPIPASLGSCQNLNLLNLRFNSLTGSIPKEIFTISSLNLGLVLENNKLTGSLPLEVGNLVNIEIVYLSYNNLSGEIPGTIGNCVALQELYLSGNFFQGSIPASLGSLRGIEVLDISHNNLSGTIPDFLQDFHDLHYLNLSFNNFEGDVPRLGVFKNASAVSVLGNNQLCGGNPVMHLPACSFQSPKRTHNFHKLVVIVSIASSLLFLFVLTCLLRVCSIRRSRRPPSSAPTQEQYVRISYVDLVRATNEFSADNLIGSGSFSAVYKGVLESDHDNMKLVAVKVLNLQIQGASKSFIAECEAMRNIRHRNLVKILTTCSSIDFKGNDFKAVIFEFMQNGSLDDWLHPKSDVQQEVKKLSLIQRLNIAVDVASALEYLHHYNDNETPIIHCDLKPSNILLDNDMTAHVGDFGQARFLKNIANNTNYSTSSIGLKGTIGYIPPEYGMGNRVSTSGDVYSYGILLLEMITARRPTDEAFKGLGLRKFVEISFPDRVMDIVDNTQIMDGESVIQCITSVLRIGIHCSSEQPEERMEMGDILSELHSIRDTFLKK